MSFLQRKTTWSNSEIGLLKFCVLLVGLVIGIYFYEFLKDSIVYLIGIFIFLFIWLFNIWLLKKPIK